jgi:creatinine amidohydrolase
LKAGQEVKTMKKTSSILVIMGLAVFGLQSAGWTAQDAKSPEVGLSVLYEELTAPDFVRAVAKSGSTCIIPLGILEKHGPHLPLGTDLIDVRELALRAARNEYTIVFPAYYVGQILEAKHQPGTVAYSAQMMMTLLQETCDELARNGVKKIILVNGHGGNSAFLHFFCQAQLAGPKDYAVYLFDPSEDPSMDEALKKLRKTSVDGHAGEEETSAMLFNRPDLVQMDRAGQQSGADQNRQAGLKHAYTGIWWYARQPNHYRGDGRYGNKEMGKVISDIESRLLVEMIASVKRDTVTLELQKQFFEGSANPLTTKQD